MNSASSNEGSGCLSRTAAGGVKEPDAAPIDVAVALHSQGVGRIEQPERCPDQLAPAVSPNKRHMMVPPAECARQCPRPAPPRKSRVTCALRGLTISSRHEAGERPPFDEPDTKGTLER